MAKPGAVSRRFFFKAIAAAVAAPVVCKVTAFDSSPTRFISKSTLDEIRLWQRPLNEATKIELIECGFSDDPPMVAVASYKDPSWGKRCFAFFHSRSSMNRMLRGSF